MLNDPSTKDTSIKRTSLLVQWCLLQRGSSIAHWKDCIVTNMILLFLIVHSTFTKRWRVWIHLYPVQWPPIPSYDAVEFSGVLINSNVINHTKWMPFVSIVTSRECTSVSNHLSLYWITRFERYNYSSSIAGRRVMIIMYNCVWLSVLCCFVYWVALYIVMVGCLPLP